MYTPQAGIFAPGTSSHAYLEFDLLDAKKCQEFGSYYFVPSVESLRRLRGNPKPA